MTIDTAIKYLREQNHTIEPLRGNNFRLTYTTGRQMHFTTMSKSTLIAYATYHKSKQ